MAIGVGIIGYKGFVGSAFYRVFSADRNYSAVGIDRENYQKLAGTNFDILVNANGNSNKRLADSDPEKDFEMNVSATKRFLEDFSFKHYVHISTIDVYNDRSLPGKTKEDAAIDPQALSNYGRSKYFGEQVAKKNAASWLILRLGGMVGENMGKGPAYDILVPHKLFISEKSRYQYLDTMDAARFAKHLVEKGRWGRIYNVAGKGNIPLSEFAAIAGVKLTESGKEVQVFNVSTSNLEAELPVPTTEETVKKFISSQR